MLSNSDLEQVREQLASSGEKLLLTLHGVDASNALSTALGEVAEQLQGFLGASVALERASGAEPRVQPALSIAASGRGTIHYAALPEGPEAAPFLQALSGDSITGTGQLDEAQLAGLEDPVGLLVLIASGCPHCPRAVQAANRLSAASPSVTTTVVDVQRFGDLAESLGARSVPMTIIDDGLVIQGVTSANELLAKVLSRGTDEYEQAVFGSLLDVGRFDAAAETVLKTDHGVARFLHAWCRSATSSRMAMMMVVERVLEADPAALNPAVDGLIESLASEAAALRGDTADLLGQIGVPRGIEALRPLLDDPNPDVAEIAAEALEDHD